MEENEIKGFLDEYRDETTRFELLELLTDRMVKELDEMPADSDRDRHRLNLIIRDLEEEIDWIESEKLAGFDPEQE